MLDFSQRLKQLRRDRHLTQAQVAKRIGVTAAMVSSYETDIRLPSYEVMVRLADLFGVTVDYLLCRQDNADERLTPIGYEIGLISQQRYDAVQEKYRQVKREVDRLEHTGVPVSPALNALLEAKGEPLAKNSVRLSDLIRRPKITYADLAPLDAGRPALSPQVAEQVEISLKYAGYIARQQRQVEEMRRLEGKLLPEEINYEALAGLRLEARQKLTAIRPRSLGQAARISGVSPADIAALMIALQEG